MTKSEVDRIKRYGLLTLAILLLICAGISWYMAWYVETNIFVLRIAGLVMALVSAYLVKLSNSYRQGKPIATTRENKNVKAPKRLAPLTWAVGVVLLLAAGLSYLWLREDAVGGYHDVLPVYVFTGIGLACILFWSYLIAKLFGRKFS